ncbi:MAG TPA: long-chain fatty acid--CoA ligase [Methylomirabilota bacterium]|nr:long-chain fatty acid--CoA ligase [Methylomirabilota bacterium]
MHVGHLLTRAALRFGDRPAWITGDTRVSFRQAEARVNRLAHALLGLGARPGDRIAMLMPNCSHGLETILAPMKAGLAVVPMNARLLPDEHAYMLDDAGARVLVYAEEFRDHLAFVRDRLRTVEHFVCLGQGARGDHDFEALIGRSPREDPPDVAIEPDAMAWLFYTSGTTGHPKGAMLTHRALLTMAQQFLVLTPPRGPADVVLHAAAITHGSGCLLFHHLAAGAANAFPLARSFDPPRIFDAIARHRVTTMFLVPTMINTLLNAPERRRYDHGSLHTVIYGGAPMYVEHLEAALGAFGPVFAQIFGQGEAPMTMTVLPQAEHVLADPVARRRLASAGRETPAVRVRIVDDEDQPRPPGELGEIVVRGDIVMKGYWNKPEATAETLRGGWLHTGDVGYLDEDGYLFITDRKKDMIISGGSNIYPREIEEVICRHPGVFEVAVIGIPDAKWGEATKALIVARPGHPLSEGEIVEHCRRHLASYKKPQSVEFLPTLPKNAYGKVLKRELRDRFWAERTRKV